jgi:hypothetical protein
MCTRIPAEASGVRLRASLAYEDLMWLNCDPAELLERFTRGLP